MFGDSITFPHLLIFFPLVAGLITFFLRKEATAKAWSLAASILTLAVSIASLCYASNAAYSGQTFSYEWMKYLGSSFAVGLDGVGRILTFLTALSFSLIFIATYKTSYKSPNAFRERLLLPRL